MLRINYYITFFLFCLLLNACNNSNGVNKEPIFKNNQPESVVYKNKLGELIRADDDALSYYLKSYRENDGHDYMEVTVSGPDILATGLVQINNPKGIEALVVKRGQGYKGAELKGLQLEVYDNPKGAILLYRSINKIID